MFTIKTVSLHLAIKQTAVIALIGWWLLACSSSTKPVSVHYTGFTQGTTYSIIIADQNQNIHISQQEIERTLTEFDTMFSTYIEQSHISKINRATSSYSFRDDNHLFRECYQLAQQIYTLSDGLFDPTVYPLVKSWGFFDKDERVPSQQEIDSISAFIDFQPGKLHEVIFKNDSVLFTKKNSAFKLDFNAIAQGFSVDVVARLLNKFGYENYCIEIGGEMYVRGHNQKKEKWNIGIENPTIDKQTIATLSLTDCGIATSGTYRNFFEREGTRYAHILHPKTGFPIQTDIISVTVMAPTAILADAYATVFVSWGTQKTIEFIQNHDQVEAVIISIDKNGKQTVHDSQQTTTQ